MKFPNGQYYVGVKDHRYEIQPTEILILGERDLPKCLKTQYQVQNETQIRKNQKIIKNNNDELILKSILKRNNQKFEPPNCPSCKQNILLEFDRGYYCQNCEYIINKQKHQIDKKVSRQDNFFLLDCQMQTKGLEKYIILWLILHIIQHKL